MVQQGQDYDQGPRSKANRVEIMIVIQSLGAASVETYGEEWENQCGCPSQLIKWACYCCFLVLGLCTPPLPTYLHKYSHLHVPLSHEIKMSLKHGIFKGSYVDDETTKISVIVEWPWSMERPTFSASKMKTWTLCAWKISFLCWNGADGEGSKLRINLISYTSIVHFSMVLWLNIGPYRYHMTANLESIERMHDWLL